MQNYRNFILITLLIAVLLSACQTGFDTDQSEKEILALHQEMIDAHLSKNVGWFTNNIADDYFSVSRGEISYPSQEEISGRFTNYLDNTEFSEYHDLQKPIVRFSKDGSLAYLIVQVKVSGNQKTEADISESFDTTWAWITLYEKENDKWIRLGEVSNYK